MIFNKDNKVKDYWKTLTATSKSHSLKEYLKETPKEEIFLQYIIDNVSKDKTIFEFGCNAGRCMRYLFGNGYKNLCGFDINQEAIRLLIENNLEMAWNGLFISGELKQVGDIFQRFDVAIAKGVLFNIPPVEIKSVIKHLCKADIVIIFEGIDNGSFIHDYHSLFRDLGFSCSKEEYYPASNSKIWKDKQTAKSYVKKRPEHDKNKLLGIFKREN